MHRIVTFALFLPSGLECVFGQAVCPSSYCLAPFINNLLARELDRRHLRISLALGLSCCCLVGRPRFGESPRCYVIPGLPKRLGSFTLFSLSSSIELLRKGFRSGLLGEQSGRGHSPMRLLNLCSLPSRLLSPCGSLYFARRCPALLILCACSIRRTFCLTIRSLRLSEEGFGPLESS